MSRWKWSRDWAGFHGGLYPTNEKASQLTVLGIYWWSYHLDVCLPLLGDVRMGVQTRQAMDSIYSQNSGRFVFDRRPWPKEPE